MHLSLPVRDRYSNPSGTVKNRTYRPVGGPTIPAELLLSSFSTTTGSQPSSSSSSSSSLRSSSLSSSSSSSSPSLSSSSSISSTTSSSFATSWSSGNQLQRSSVIIVIFILLVVTIPGAAELRSRFSEHEIQLIRRSFLKRFGMREEPRQTRPVLPLPKYIWNIYDRVRNDEIEWVRHYYPKQIIQLDQKVFLLQYDLSVSVQNTSNERISRADLKLKLAKSNSRRRNIKVYEVDEQSKQLGRLIESKVIETSTDEDHQWVDLNVLQALQRIRPEMNQIDLAIELSGEQTGLFSGVAQSDTVSGMALVQKQAAALVLYVQSSDFAKVRQKRRANGRRRHQHRKHNHRSQEKNYCRRRQLLVDFNELNWQDWILAPSSYSAYQCQGECPNPLSAHFNTTNHAIVQGLIHSVDPNLVPAPCCVPIEMESLAILYIDVESKIVIKNYPDMQVLSCGCR